MAISQKFWGKKKKKKSFTMLVHTKQLQFLFLCTGEMCSILKCQFQRLLHLCDLYLYLKIHFPSRIRSALRFKTQFNKFQIRYYNHFFSSDYIRAIGRYYSIILRIMLLDQLSSAVRRPRGKTKDSLSRLVMSCARLYTREHN